MVAAMGIRVGNPLRKLVLIKLADNASDQGECWPSYQHIADQCEISRRSVMSHISALCDAGLIRKEIRKSGPKGNSSNVYILTLGSAGDSLGVVQEIHHTSAADSLGGGEPDSPRTSHSFEPVIEPIATSANAPVATSSKTRKPRCEKFDPLTCQPVNVSAQAWADWCQHRAEIKKPLTAKTCAAQSRLLAAHHNPDAVIAISIVNGWQGLFPEKITHDTTDQRGYHGGPVSAADRVRQAIAERERAANGAAQPVANRPAVAENVRTVRPALDGEFWRVG